MALFPHLMAPALWERPGNIPPLVRLLQAYIEKGGKQIETEKVVSINSYINTSKHSFVLQVFASLYCCFFLINDSLYEILHSHSNIIKYLYVLLQFTCTCISIFQNGLLGIFQKLIASKTNDHEGFYLLNSILEHMPRSDFMHISIFKVDQFY